MKTILPDNQLSVDALADGAIQQATDTGLHPKETGSETKKGVSLYMEDNAWCVEYCKYKDGWSIRNKRSLFFRLDEARRLFKKIAKQHDLKLINHELEVA